MFQGYTETGGQSQNIFDCNPVIFMRDLKENGVTTFMDGKTAPDWAVAIPCGLQAKYVFNDTYELYKNENDGTFT